MGLRWTPASAAIGSQVFRCSPQSSPLMASVALDRCSSWRNRGK
jgi:hypothetical protein